MKFQVIREEVSVNHQRVENDMVFEDETKKNPGLFENLMWEFVSKDPVPKYPRRPVPKYDFLKAKSLFSFASLLTRAEVVDALARVREECNKERRFRY